MSSPFDSFSFESRQKHCRLMLHARPLPDPGANEVGFLSATRASHCFHGGCPVDAEATPGDARNSDSEDFGVLQNDLLAKTSGEEK